MDMDKPLHTEKISRNVKCMDELNDEIANVSKQVQELQNSRSTVRLNGSLTSKEVSILVVGLDLAIMKHEREIFRLKAQLATHKLKFQKETFWQNL